MIHRRKTLEEYQTEINVLEMQAIKDIRIDASEPEGTESEVRARIESSFESEFKIRTLRNECVGLYGSNSLWPEEQTPGVIGELLVTGIIIPADISPWFESKFNTFKLVVDTVSCEWF